MDYKSTKGNNYHVSDNIEVQIDKHKPIRYDRNLLLAINTATHRTRLNGDTVTKMRKLRINKRHRGKRGGNKHGYKNRKEWRTHNSLNLNNLIQVSLQQAAETTIEVNFSTINTQSLRNKGFVALEDLKNNAVDLSVLTETWIDNTENEKARLLSSPFSSDGLRMYTKNRVGNKGGGIALVSKDKYKVNTLALAEPVGFEAQVWKVEICRDMVLTIIGLYRPPYSVRNGNTVTKFLDEFTPWIVNIISNYSNIILMGDFNIHVGNEDDAGAMTFLDTIEALGLEQWVEKLTHRSDNILDLVISGIEDKTKPVRCTTEGFISDHRAVYFTLQLKKSMVMKKSEVTYCKLKKIDINKFTQVLLDLACIDLKDYELDGVISKFETKLKQTLDKHAPEVTKKIMERKKQP